MKDSTRQQADALAGARPPLLLTATADTSSEESSSARLAALARRGSAWPGPRWRDSLQPRS